MIRNQLITGYALGVLALINLSSPALAAEENTKVGVESSSNELNISDAVLDKTFAPFKTSCFEILDFSTGKTFRYHAEQCAKRLPPMSTFKIFNSLAGLESGFLTDENHSMKWDGHNYAIKEWNQDQTLATAVRYSVVWYFKKVAAGVGEQRMQKYLDATHYGNNDISGGITKFWLASSLQISADEQVDFVKRLYADELPFSRRSMNIVKKITQLKTTEKGEVHGKTGTDENDNKSTLGWFVGYVVHDHHSYVFATNIQADEGAYGPKARDLTYEILERAGLL